MLLLFGGAASESPLLRKIYTSAGATGPQLQVARYSGDGQTLYEVLDAPQRVGVRWSLPGGVQRLEVTVKSRNNQEAFDRYRYNIGDMIVLYDDYLDMPMARGWVYEGRYNGHSVTYICAGAWKRHSDRRVKLAPDPAEDTDVYLAGDVLASVLDGNLDTTGIEATGVALLDYEIDTVTGTPAAKIIADILRMGDSGANILDYWIDELPFDIDGGIKHPRANLKPRLATADPTWRITQADISASELSRNAWGMRNDITIFHAATTTLAADANGGATAVTVASAMDIKAEYEIEIYLDSGRTHRSAVDSVSGTTVTLVTALPNTGTNPTATSGALVRVTSPLTATQRTDTPASDRYWLVEHAETRAIFGTVQAQNYGDAMLTALARPASENGFSIGGPYIKDSLGQKWPIWRILTNPGIIEISDISPDGELYSAQLDSLRSFRVVAVDYDHASRSVRITPDAYFGEQRLDVILQHLGAQVGQMINREV